MIILALGSNLGDRLAYLQAAINKIREKNILSNVECAKIYESPAMLKADSPLEWDINFLNTVIIGKSDLSAMELLIEIKKIEQELGRKARGRWSPREIDIDIIAYGSEIHNEENLTLPHADFDIRDFVLKPLCDVAANWICPLRNKTAIQMLLELEQSQLQPTSLSVA